MLVVYQLKVGFCLIAFYLLFKLLFSHDTLHRFNRVLLLTLVGVSLVLPWVKLSIDSPTAVGQGVVMLSEVFVSQNAAAEASFSWRSLLHLLYILGSIAAFCGFIYADYKPRKLINTWPSVDGGAGVKIHVVAGNQSPFSYFHHIVISADDYNGNARELLAHERAHIRLGHSYDVLLLNVLLLFQWWNPAVWLLKRELQQIHEFEADEAVLNEGVDARQYQLLLIRKSVGDQLFSMANNFNHHSLKRRIRMMTQKRTNRWQVAKVLAVLPVAALLALACAQKSERPAEEPAGAASVTAESDSAQVFDVVEQMPEFPGGSAELLDYLMENLKYPKDAEESKTEGRVIVTFVVDEEGRIVEPQVAKGVSPSLDAEALRVVQSMPQWTPGRQHGEAVRVRYTVPINFQLK